MAEAVRLETVSKTYGSGDSSVDALREVSLTFTAGSFTAVMGPSGSGKSTLQCAAGLDRPTSGRVFVAGHDLTGLDETALTLLRRERVGFVFQSFNLLPSLTAAQNVALTQLVGSTPVVVPWAPVTVVVVISAVLALLGVVLPVRTALRTRAVDLAGMRE
ncbi:hypothetical protein GCM10020369_07540 [Cryptosporangium minutisporangium]|uniref:ABC transporter domain-containing protein n=1 Tax=Cryptosporangium minutisporangium TaxID=113569 RepID=A0ABP6SQR6_9ACTN